ncbi:MAG: hypothetical protein LCH54_15775 [Bacteroidetes bacterium]|nr:hypothetical protein [Bacteroidota bacterium]
MENKNRKDENSRLAIDPSAVAVVLLYQEDGHKDKQVSVMEIVFKNEGVNDSSKKILLVGDYENLEPIFSKLRIHLLNVGFVSAGTMAVVDPNVIVGISAFIGDAKNRIDLALRVNNGIQIYPLFDSEIEDINNIDELIKANVKLLNISI